MRLKLAPSEAPTAVYSALAAIEHLKETSLLAGAPPADPRFAKALPQLASEGRQLRALEQGMKTAHAEHQKKTKEAQKTQKALDAQAQKEAQRKADHENFMAETKNRLETAFGQGMLAKSLWKMGQEGRGTEALRLVKTVLAQGGKGAEEQAAIAEDLKIRFKRMARQKRQEKLATDGQGLTPQAKAELAADGRGLAQIDEEDKEKKPALATDEQGLNPQAKG